MAIRRLSRNSASSIQSCGWFISDQQFWLTGQCHGNHDALLLATRQLMRVSIHAFLRLGYAHFFKEFASARISLFA
jgi:hypothetical protein